MGNIGSTVDITSERWCTSSEELLADHPRQIHIGRVARLWTTWPRTAAMQRSRTTIPQDSRTQADLSFLIVPRLCTDRRRSARSRVYTSQNSLSGEYTINDAT